MRIGTLPCTWPAARYTQSLVIPIGPSQREYSGCVSEFQRMDFYFVFTRRALPIPGTWVWFLTLSCLLVPSGSWDVRPADSGRDPQSHSCQCYQQCSANVRTCCLASLLVMKWNNVKSFVVIFSMSNWFIVVFDSLALLQAPPSRRS